MKKIIVFLFIMSLAPIGSNFAMDVVPEATGETKALFDAINNENIEEVQKLVKNKNLSFFEYFVMYNGNYTNLLFFAKNKGNQKIINILAFATLSDDEKKLFNAIQKNDLNKVTELISEKKLPNFIDSRDVDGNTPLIHAVITDNIDIIKAVLSLTPNPNVANIAGKTARSIAENSQNKNQIIPLLDAAKKQFTLYENLFALRQKAWRNEEITQNDIDSIAKLIPDTSLNVPSGRNPLIVAIQTKSLPLVQLLINNKADVNQYIYPGMTPLLRASLEPKTADIANFLINQNANPNVSLSENELSFTPLMLAVIHNQPSLLENLIKHGADTKAKNSLGLTALDMAKKQEKENYQKIITLLEKSAMPDKQGAVTENLTPALNQLTHKLHIIAKLLKT